MLKALLKKSWIFQRRSFKQQNVEGVKDGTTGARAVSHEKQSVDNTVPRRHHGGDHGDSASACISQHIFEPIIVEVMKVVQNMDVCQAELDMPVLRERARTRRTEVRETKNMRNKTYICFRRVCRKILEVHAEPFFIA